LAEFERSIINERASEGRAIAKAKGDRFGRKPSLSSKEIQKIKVEYESGESMRAIALDYVVGCSTVSRAIAN